MHLGPLCVCLSVCLSGRVTQKTIPPIDLIVVTQEGVHPWLGDYLDRDLDSHIYF